jgi:plasmid stabilization system protein ParE
MAILERIAAWIAKDSPEAARSVTSRIFDAIDRLAEFPGLGHRVKVEGTREWPVRGLPYIIVYTLDQEHGGEAPPQLLTVIGVFHGAQDRG